MLENKREEEWKRTSYEAERNLNGKRRKGFCVNWILKNMLKTNNLII